MKVLKYTTEKVFDGYMKVNSCGQQWLGDRDHVTLRDKGRVDYSIYYIAKGQGYFIHEGKSISIPEGSLLMYLPGIRHHYGFRKEDNTQMLWSHFSGTACRQLDSLTSNAPIVIPIEDRKQFLHVFERMITAHYHRMNLGDALCDSYMPVLLALMTLHTHSSSQNNIAPGNEQMEQVLSRMHVGFNKPIDIREYAAMCHLSEDRFIRLFKSHMGMPPYRYQLKIRIQRAVEMLENSAISVSECGEAVGFHDNAYFCRIFKKFTGHPPSFYRK